MKKSSNRFLCLWLTALLVAIPGGAVSQLPSKNSQRTDESVMRIRTDVVSLSVTVTGRDGRLIGGLQRDDFEVYENKVRQPIEYFSDADQPATVGVIFDVSGSMKSHFAQASAALHRFTEAGHSEDEYFLMSFNHRISEPLEVMDGSALMRRVGMLTPHGDTALYDAIHEALGRLQKSRNHKRALLVISDGADNHSRAGISELRRQLREAGITIYAIGANEPTSSSCQRICHFEAQARLESLAEMTGGAAFFPNSDESLEQAVSQIALELRRQYSLGYVSTLPPQDGSWRKIKVQLRANRPGEKISVRTREGYFAAP